MPGHDPSQRNDLDQDQDERNIFDLNLYFCEGSVKKESYYSVLNNHMSLYVQTLKI